MSCRSRLIHTALHLLRYREDIRAIPPLSNNNNNQLAIPTHSNLNHMRTTLHNNSPDILHNHRRAILLPNNKQATLNSIPGTNRQATLLNSIPGILLNSIPGTNRQATLLNNNR